MVGYGTSSYVLAGWTLARQNRLLYLSDVYVHSSQSMLWSFVRTSGTQPVARAYAAACAHRGRIFMFGGTNGPVASSFRNDLMVLDLETLKWAELRPAVPGVSPNGRAHHAMAVYAGAVYVHGGTNIQGGEKRVLGDLWHLDPSSREWTLQSDADVGGGPAARSGHGMAVCNDGLFVFGGAGEGLPHEERDARGRPNYFDSLWVWNLVARAWHNLTPRHDPATDLVPARPPARAGGVVLGHDTRLFVLLGQNAVPDPARGGHSRPALPPDVFRASLARWHRELPASAATEEARGANLAGRALAAMTRGLGHTGGETAALSPGGTRGLRAGERGAAEEAGPADLEMVRPPPRARLPRVRRVSRGGVGVVRARARAEPRRAGQIWELKAPGGARPHARSGHAMAAVGRRVYVFGGLVEEEGRRDYRNDTHVLDVNTGTWSEVVPKHHSVDDEPLPEPRAGHSMVVVEAGRNVIWMLFGWAVEGNHSAYFGDVHRFDPIEGEWHGVEPSAGPRPDGRGYAAAATLRSDIYVFGGCSGALASSFRNDMWKFDTAAGAWSKIVLPAHSDPPPGRSQHAMVQYGGTLYIFGGNNKRGGRRHLLGDLVAFDPFKLTYREITDGSSGEGPSRRSGHTMCVLTGGIFVFGGAGDEESTQTGGTVHNFFDALWVFDTPSQRWVLLSQENEEGLVGSKRPVARAGHAACCVGRELLVLGGLCPKGGGSEGLRPLDDLASLDTSGWRKSIPKVVTERRRLQATRLLARLQGLDDHASSRLLESMHMFKGAARDAYNEALNDPYGEHEEPREDEKSDGLRLSPAISAALSALNMRVDGMLARIAPERAAVHQLQRAIALGPVMAKGGRLRVHVHSGRDLPKMDRFGKSDPYVVVEVDGQTRKTKTLKKTLNPVWKEDFEIRVADSVTSVVTFSCFDWDFADAHDFMGKVEVKIETLLERDLDQFFTLRDEVPKPPCPRRHAVEATVGGGGRRNGREGGGGFFTLRDEVVPLPPFLSASPCVARRL